MRTSTVRVLGVGLVALVAGGGCAHMFGTKPSETFVARKRLARELIAQQDWPGAFFYADQLHREQPDDAEVILLRGIIYRERGLPAEAERDLKAAIDLEGELAEAHSNLGILYDTTSRGDLGDKHHRRATALAPRNAVFLNNLGFSLFLRHKWREAIEAYQQGVRIDPTARRLRTNLGFAHAAAGDMPRAAREFDMGGAPWEARNNLGFAYEQAGNLPRAYDLYAEALRLNPKSARTRANLVEVARRLGRDVPPEVSMNAEGSGTP